MPTALRRHVSRLAWPSRAVAMALILRAVQYQFMPLPKVLRAAAICFLAAALAAIARPAKAGGGPENVLLVVNSRSDASLTVANHYCRLRRIPPSNVVDLDWPGSTDWTDIETFRQKILQPALQTAAERGLGEQIDYVVYSSDFPTRIDFASEWPPEQRGKQVPSGSLTSLTYLYEPVLLRSTQFAGPHANRYTAPLRCRRRSHIDARLSWLVRLGHERRPARIGRRTLSALHDARRHQRPRKHDPRSAQLSHL